MRRCFTQIFLLVSSLLAVRALPPLGMRPDIINDDRARRPQQRSHMHQALLLDRDMPEVRISPSEPGVHSPSAMAHKEAHDRPSIEAPVAKTKDAAASSPSADFSQTDKEAVVQIPTRSLDEMVYPIRQNKADSRAKLLAAMAALEQEKRPGDEHVGPISGSFTAHTRKRMGLPSFAMLTTLLTAGAVLMACTILSVLFTTPNLVRQMQQIGVSQTLYLAVRRALRHARSALRTIMRAARALDPKYASLPCSTQDTAQFQSGTSSPLRSALDTLGQRSAPVINRLRGQQ